VGPSQVYYVVDTPSPTTFTFAATPGGPPITTASASGPLAAVVTSVMIPPPPPAAPPVSTADPYTVTVRQALPADVANEVAPAGPVTISSTNKQAVGLDFLNVQKVTLSGVVFHDINANGRQDPGEAGVPGVQVQVAVPGQAAPVVLTTDVNGFWQGAFDP